MKQFISFCFIALGVISFSSCSKDEDKAPNLEGTWYVHQESYVVAGETVHTEILEGCDKESNFRIAADNSVEYRNFLNCNGFTSQTGTYNPETNQVILVHENAEYVFEVEYKEGELLLSTTYKVRVNDGEIDETMIYHCQKGEPQVL